MQTKLSVVKDDKKRHIIKEKMKNVVLQNPKVKAVFERLKDK
ncbi:hypothetical protein [Campylobacter suis]|uniref:Uncharacterized protein n=1 Tax=Campylobacter suis TaxID=2790657 RepID=A0ABN7K718_9BACT|nr:hypothetical protein [Campylobacter suis]CAD7288272.1 hypothetical protein LMG8286_01240 [Campylobacter suis]